MLNAHGKAIVFGDNVNTDVILPGKYLNVTDPQELASHCMETEDPEFLRKIQAGDVMVAGMNFGCGSSREHAPLAIKYAGISCVVAATFARIFYRNAVNIGLAIVECPEAAKEVKAGDEVSVDFGTGVITDHTTGKAYQASVFPPFMQKIIDCGGLVPYTAQKLKAN